MRKLLVVFLLGCTLCTASRAQTQTPDAGPSWQRLQGLPSGLGISVKARGGSGNCAFKSASEAELVCASSNGTLRTFQRADIKRVRLRHRGRSTLVGLAIGATAGAVAGAATCKKGDIVGPGACAVVLGVPGALIGALVGASTDFTHSTVYRAP
jgi:hypothetical protein